MAFCSALAPCLSFLRAFFAGASSTCPNRRHAFAVRRSMLFATVTPAHSGCGGRAQVQVTASVPVTSSWSQPLSGTQTSTVQGSRSSHAPGSAASHSGAGDAIVVELVLVVVVTGRFVVELFGVEVEVTVLLEV